MDASFRVATGRPGAGAFHLAPPRPPVFSPRIAALCLVAVALAVRAVHAGVGIAGALRRGGRAGSGAGLCSSPFWRVLRVLGEGLAFGDGRQENVVRIFLDIHQHLDRLDVERGVVQLHPCEAKLVQKRLPQIRATHPWSSAASLFPWSTCGAARTSVSIPGLSWRGRSCICCVTRAAKEVHCGE
ncbi:hypothetical protein ABB37_09705 [Leptomonas pyrrhocoris]|uniref:Uncharacterized protein n=1 Tax=Leptomonas pyrrhocoris TaxID=157538 RepID=A0A0M9FPX4_LEPPY|nr:hypothetical protein ABB37_09705 [Leptomonas pyrrhocoris]KPA73573.1 hypothetical protein ABB37_09705 [Leptomonas pyrrhocoris]|eukprot:XP_015652012.1 hypothetical protein ABB37_09705 [Leptomonas pyrrhocoris]